MRIPASVAVAVTFMSVLAACGGGTGNSAKAGAKGPHGPQCLSTHPETAYVSNAQNNSVTPIPVATDVPDAAIQLPPAGAHPWPIPIDASRDGTAVYVADNGGGIAVRIDANTEGVTDTIKLEPGSQPTAIAVAPNGKFVLVASQGTNHVQKILVNRPSFPDIPGPVVAVQGKPAGIAITANSQTAYVTSGPATVTPINTSGAMSAGTPIPLAANAWPLGIALTPTTAYVADEVHRAVVPVALPSGPAGTPLPIDTAYPYAKDAHDIAITHDGTTAYVAELNAARVTGITLPSTVRPAIAFPPWNINWAIAITTDDSKAYVVNGFVGNVVPIKLDNANPSNGKAGTPIAVGGDLQDVAISPGCPSLVANNSKNAAGAAVPGGSTSDTNESRTSTPSSSTSTTGITTTTLRGPSIGCTDVNKPVHSGPYGSASVTDQFYAGETVTISATGASGTPPPTNIELSGSPTPSTPVTVPVDSNGNGTLSYTFPATVNTTITWKLAPPSTNGRQSQADWSVDCS